MANRTNTPRRNDILRMTAAERVIRDAMLQVEAMGADPLLTFAVLLLGKARDSVADYVDSQAEESSSVR